MAQLWTDIYQEHFQHYFQKPFDIQIFHDPHGASLKLATHDWALHGYRVYASMGLADRLARMERESVEPDALAGSEHVTASKSLIARQASAEPEADFGEVILYADVPDKEVPQLFVNALFFILHNRIALDSRFVVGFGAAGAAFARRYQKTAFYFARARGPDDKFDKVRSGQSFGRVYQAYFLTPAEDDYLEENGADAFESEFMAHTGDWLSVRRPSCV